MTTLTPATVPAMAEPSTVELRPRYEGANICTWIGFKHVNYLIEEAVYSHLRNAGLPAGKLYEDYGLCTDVVHIDTRILHAFHIDDVVHAEVRPARGAGGDELRFAVVLRVLRDTMVKATTAEVEVKLRTGGVAAPADLARFTVDRLTATSGAQAADVVVDAAAVAESLVAGRNAFVWRWRIPYFYCHFTEYLQMSGYLRLMEEVVDLFLADRGISIKRLLDERNLIPVVPRSQVTVLDEARMEEELYTVLTVEEIFKNLTYTARMDTYVVRDGVLVRTSTGRITHGYAIIENRRDWRLASFDTTMVAALSGKAEPMSDPTVLDKEELRLLIADVLDVGASAVGDDVDFFADLDADSLMAMEITARLEKRYEVRISEGERMLITTVRATHDLLARKIGGSS
ncbi:phosphopantetheine-binding protein [Kibdelosporangium persicum]|uniref:Acyl-CoA thioesterase FadM n=1 Tax=Kibdelosporangium persicum TaxID=2698649 RepID=A0ABX2FHS9_9PSEU|nr:phosphopantetheine-binding protein [Kibdelosporangium persicum]NRN70956.1 Acyl-CoA thioesterase FadM [Kibdelosporangium persicum]